MGKTINRFLLIVFALIVLVGIGTCAFSIAENLDPFDAFYLTVTILSTVGFGDITPKTFGGKLVYIGLVLTGIGVFGYAVSSIATIMAERSIFKMVKGVLLFRGDAKLRDHVIIVGWNETTKSVCDELRSNGCRVVVIVEDDAMAREVSRSGYDVIVGSPLEPSTYQEAKITSARSAILAMDNESKNLMAILRIRDLNRDLKIITVCNNEFMKKLFYRAGADEVVNTADISGRILASHVFEPVVAEILEDMAEAETGLDAEQVIFKSAGTTRIRELRDLGFKSVILLVIRDSQKIYYPGDDFEIKSGDIMVLIGLREDLDSDKGILEKHFGMTT